MAAFNGRISLIFVLAVSPSLLQAADPQAPPTDSPLKLGKIPDLQLPARPPADEARIKRIKELIASLATLDRPDFGFSPTLSGDKFSPLLGQARFSGGLLIGNHGLQTSGPLKDLVTIGADALPYLLDALDDPTPTKLNVKHTGGFGGMWHANELPLNPVNPAEVAAYEERHNHRQQKDVNSKFYTLNVGDICFVAIGQIVGRRYAAVRYQPSACIVLNCPSHDPQFCAQVRSIWKSTDPREKLFNSLLADFSTEVMSDATMINGWRLASKLQYSATLRLLYYFPEIATPFFAARLDRLNVSDDKGSEGFQRRLVENGVYAGDFIRALAWSEDPTIRTALIGVFRRAGDMDAMLAALPAVVDGDLIRDRFDVLSAALPADEGGPYGSYFQGYRLLKELADRTPANAQPILKRYLRNSSVQRCHTVCLVLREAKLDCDIDLLAPLLLDKRNSAWTYALTPSNEKPRRAIRICDEAAVTLSQNHPEFKFVQAGEHSELDKQIVAIRAQIERKK